MNLHLQNAAVLVAGGSNGIGLACAARLAREGARVAIVGRDEARLARAEGVLRALGGEVLALRAECADPQACAAAVDAVVSAFGGLSVLVNSAGRAARFDAAHIDAAAWHDAIQTKLLPYVLMQDAVLAHWRAHPLAPARTAARAIVNVIGAGGKLPSPRHVTGGAANAALMLATAGLAQAYAAQGIRINGVNPSLIERGEEWDDAFLGDGALPAALALADHPMGRKGVPWEVANVVAFLASPLASYVNGAVLQVDGGLKAVV